MPGHSVGPARAPGGPGFRCTLFAKALDEGTQCRVVCLCGAQSRAHAVDDTQSARTSQPPDPPPRSRRGLGGSPVPARAAGGRLARAWVVFDEVVVAGTADDVRRSAALGRAAFVQLVRVRAILRARSGDAPQCLRCSAARALCASAGERAERTTTLSWVPCMQRTGHVAFLMRLLLGNGSQSEYTQTGEQQPPTEQQPGIDRKGARAVEPCARRVGRRRGSGGHHREAGS